jgi:hypothetical protein
MLLQGAEIKDRLNTLLLNNTYEATLISAFLKNDILEELKDILGNRKVKIYVRWQLFDLVMKASDLSIYETCKSMGWRLFINPRLHAKMIIIDGTHAILGSSNYTLSGLGRSRNNIEWNFEIERQLTKDEHISIQKSLSLSIEMNDLIFENITNEVANEKDAFNEYEALRSKVRMIPKSALSDPKTINDLFPPFSPIEEINFHNEEHRTYLKYLEIFSTDELHDLGNAIYCSPYSKFIRRLADERANNPDVSNILRWGNIPYEGFDRLMLAENNGLENLFHWIETVNPNSYRYFSNRPNGTCSLERIISNDI